MKFNINKNIKCKLTSYGETILKFRNPTSYKYNYDKTTKILIEQLWVLINIFGGEFYLTMEDNLIVDNEIELINNS